MSAFLLVKTPGNAEDLSVDDLTYNSVSLSWKKAKNASGYLIYRAEKGHDYSCIGECSTPNYKDEDIKTGREYRYKITSKNGFKHNRKYSEELKVPPTLDVPKLKIDTSTGRIIIHVGMVNGATDYEIYRNGQLISTQKGRTCIDSKAIGDIDFKYKARAVIRDPKTYKVKAASNMSKEKSSRIVSVGKLNVELTGDTLLFSWDKSDKYTKYKLFDEQAAHTPSRIY